MNSKSEFHQPSIVRVVAIRGNINEEQTGAALNPGRRGGDRTMMAGRNQAISPRAGRVERDRFPRAGGSRGAGRGRNSRPGDAYSCLASSSPLSLLSVLCF